MVFIKKFFDDDAEGTGFGGGAPFNPFEGAKSGEVVFGGAPTVTDDNVVDDKAPEAVVEVVKDPVVDDKKKSSDAEVADVVADVDAKDTKAIVDEKPVITDKVETVVETKPQVFNLDEELKKVDKYEVLGKLGFDKFEIDLLRYKEQTGDVTPYLEAKTVDYSKFSDEQMMKYDLKNQYKGISDKSFEQLYKQEVTDKYILDADIHGVAAAELGLELLKLKANKVRESAVSEQAKFKAPEKLVDDSAQKQQQANDLKIAEYKDYVNESDNTKAILKDKKLVFGTGETAFNYTVDSPTSLVDTIHQPMSLFNDLTDVKGNVDIAKFLKVKAYALDPDKHDNLLIAHGKTIGEKGYHEGLTNPSVKETKAAIKSEPELTPAQALARHGKIRQEQN